MRIHVNPASEHLRSFAEHLPELFENGGEVLHTGRNTIKAFDVEAWSPRQKKYFEVGSCSNLGDAQARRLGIRVKDADGNKYFANTLNNTVVAPPRMLIAFLEKNLQADGSVRIPEVLRPYMGGMTEIKRK